MTTQTLEAPPRKRGRPAGSGASGNGNGSPGKGAAGGLGTTPKKRIRNRGKTTPGAGGGITTAFPGYQTAGMVDHSDLATSLRNFRLAEAILDKVDARPGTFSTAPLNLSGILGATEKTLAKMWTKVFGAAPPATMTKAV